MKIPAALEQETKKAQFSLDEYIGPSHNMFNIKQENFSEDEYMRTSSNRLRFHNYESLDPKTGKLHRDAEESREVLEVAPNFFGVNREYSEYRDPRVYAAGVRNNRNIRERHSERKSKTHLPAFPLGTPLNYTPIEDYNPQELSKFTFKELLKHCRERNLPIKGTNDQLIQRLINWKIKQLPKENSLIKAQNEQLKREIAELQVSLSSQNPEYLEATFRSMGLKDEDIELEKEIPRIQVGEYPSDVRMSSACYDAVDDQ